eukprot:TRINITY_DN12414_c0_g1_i1.p1 TRINITY_DN12414_c0_g1~~TRINITY_DN12414_c0_g1_i1.p1  ORF type:complete len:198 (-),score=31.04 TRINITY_DN12414_c0_g1_i1:826-1374(-)
MICVDLFVFAHAYIDLTTLSIVPTITGGQVYHYPSFSLERGDGDRLRFDLKRHLTRPHGYDAVMRVRSSKGLVPYEYLGNFASPNNADLEMAGVDCDKAIVVMLKHDDKLEDKSEPTLQAAMLYTTVEGQEGSEFTQSHSRPVLFLPPCLKARISILLYPFMLDKLLEKYLTTIFHLSKIRS